MRRLLTPGWLAAHAAVLVAVAAFVGLGWWQAGRAADGNTLSWAYTVEWPLFAVFTVVLWVREMRMAVRAGASHPSRDTARAGAAVPVADATDPAGAPVRRAPVITRRPPTVATAQDPDLAAYNTYLTWFNEHPEAKPSDYPG